MIGESKAQHLKTAGMPGEARSRDPQGTTSSLQIRISTMSDRSWTLVAATESREGVLWLLLHPRRLSGSEAEQAEVLSAGLSVWVLPSLLPCLVWVGRGAVAGGSSAGTRSTVSRAGASACRSLDESPCQL